MSYDNFDKNFAYNFALGDSKHDMGTKMNDGTDTNIAVDNTRPKDGDFIGKNADIPHPSEDAMLLEYAFGGGEVPRDKSKTSDYDLKGEVAEVYEHFSLNDDTVENLFKKIFSEVQAIDSLTLIVDFGYSNIREQLNNYNAIGRGDNKTVYWYQCPETDLDPAEKTKFHSGKFFGTNVCFATAPPAQQTIFPQWGENLNGGNVDTYDYKHGDNSDFHEKMFFSNYHCQLSYENNREEDYKKQKAWLLMKSPEDKYSYVTSSWAAIKKGPIKKSVHASYKKSGLMLFKQYKTKVDLNIDIYSNEAQIIGKRIGDGGQALVCLKEIDKLIKRTGQRAIDQQEVILNNNKNVFVSHDRLAILFALKIRVPIVIWNRMESFVVFINKKLKTDKSVFDLCKLVLTIYNSTNSSDSLKNVVLPSVKQYNNKTYKDWFAELTLKKKAIDTKLGNLADDMKTQVETNPLNADEAFRNYIKHVCYFSNFLIDYKSLEGMINETDWTDHSSNIGKLSTQATAAEVGGDPNFDANEKVTTADESKLQNYKTFYSTYETVVGFNAKGKEKEIERLIDNLNKFQEVPDVPDDIESSVPSNIKRDVKEIRPYFWSQKLLPASARKKANELSLIYQDKATQHFGLKSLIPLLKGMYNKSSKHCDDYFSACYAGGTETYKHIYNFFVKGTPLMTGGNPNQQYDQEFISGVNTRSFTKLYDLLTNAEDLSNFKDLLTTPEKWETWIKTSAPRTTEINKFIKKNEDLFSVFQAHSIQEKSIKPFFQHIDEILNFFRTNFLIMSDENSDEVLFEEPGESGSEGTIIVKKRDQTVKTNIEGIFVDGKTYDDEPNLDTILDIEYSKIETEYEKLTDYKHSEEIKGESKAEVADSLLNNYDSDSVLVRSTNFINNYHESEDNRPMFQEPGAGSGGGGQKCLKHINNDDFTCKCASCNGGTNAGIKTSDDIASMVKIFSRVVSNENACKYFKKLTEEIYVDAEPNTINNIKVCLFGLFVNINSTDEKVLKINEILDGLLIVSEDMEGVDADKINYVVSEDMEGVETPKGKGVKRDSLTPSTPQEEKKVATSRELEEAPKEDSPAMKLDFESEAAPAAPAEAIKLDFESAAAAAAGGGKKTKKKRKNKKRKKTKRHRKYNKKTKKKQKHKKKRKSTK